MKCAQQQRQCYFVIWAKDKLMYFNIYSIIKRMYELNASLRYGLHSICERFQFISYQSLVEMKTAKLIRTWKSECKKKNSEQKIQQRTNE